MGEPIGYAGLPERLQRGCSRYVGEGGRLGSCGRLVRGSERNSSRETTAKETGKEDKEVASSRQTYKPFGLRCAVTPSLRHTEWLGCLAAWGGSPKVLSPYGTGAPSESRGQLADSSRL